MGYTYVKSLHQAIRLFARELKMSREDIEAILGDGKETIFKKIKNRNNRELLFIPDNSGFICAVEY